MPHLRLLQIFLWHGNHGKPFITSFFYHHPRSLEEYHGVTVQTWSLIYIQRIHCLMHLISLKCPSNQLVPTPTNQRTSHPTWVSNYIVSCTAANWIAQCDCLLLEYWKRLYQQLLKSQWFCFFCVNWPPNGRISYACPLPSTRESLVSRSLPLCR